jgi:hypothetical protein
MSGAPICYQTKIAGPGGYSYNVLEKGHRLWEVSVLRHWERGGQGGPRKDVHGSLKKATREARRLCAEFMAETADDVWPPNYPEPEQPPMPESFIESWEEELSEHPVVAELRAKPGRWAILATPVNEAAQEVWDACRWHPNVQVYNQGLMGDCPMLHKARWLPDPVMAAVTILKGRGLDA